MPYKNIKGILTDATKFPAAIEAMLPEGAPKVSTMLLDAAGQIPVVPDFPIEIPDLPAPPVLPAAPIGNTGLTRYVSGVTVSPVGAAPAARSVVARPQSEVVPLLFE
uniref:Uncharacterized protein n=1 Tax=viral metagenome TaxID=1070528 RepID=A0A6M3MBV1_9ZZZZ